jgi:hypothetical protein
VSSTPTTSGLTDPLPRRLGCQQIELGWRPGPGAQGTLVIPREELSIGTLAPVAG